MCVLLLLRDLHFQKETLKVPELNCTDSLLSGLASSLDETRSVGSDVLEGSLENGGFVLFQEDGNFAYYRSSLIFPRDMKTMCYLCSSNDCLIGNVLSAGQLRLLLPSWGATLCLQNSDTHCLRVHLNLPPRSAGRDASVVRELTSPTWVSLCFLITWCGHSGEHLMFPEFSNCWNGSKAADFSSLARQNWSTMQRFGSPICELLKIRITYDEESKVCITWKIF